MGLSLKISQSNTGGEGLYNPAFTKVALNGVDISGCLKELTLFVQDGEVPVARLYINLDSVEVDADTITSLTAWVPKKNDS
jgi:hypothetical protein